MLLKGDTMAWQLLDDRNNFIRGVLAKDEDYRPVPWHSGRAVRFSAWGAILRTHEHPLAAVCELAKHTWIGQEQRKYWAYLTQWWSDHTDSFVVVETLKKLRI